MLAAKVLNDMALGTVRISMLQGSTARTAASVSRDKLEMVAPTADAWVPHCAEPA